MIDNTYDRFMIWSAEGRGRTVDDSDGKTLMITTHFLARSMVLPDV